MHYLEVCGEESPRGATLFCLLDFPLQYNHLHHPLIGSPSARGAARTSASVIQIGWTAKALAETRFAAALATTAIEDCAVPGVLIVIATRPPIQYASEKVLST